MDYTEVRQAFFSPREGEVRELGWDSPARRLRDAIEPLAMICFWSEPAYDAYAARGLDFLGGYVCGRASALGEPAAPVVAAAFGVFEPGLVADLYDGGRQVCPLADTRTAREEGAVAALRAVFGEPGDAAEPARTTAALREAAATVPTLGRPLFAGLLAQPEPADPWGALWHACSVLRELRGDSHLAALVPAGLDGAQANLLTEMWIGWEPLVYTGSRAWTPEAMQAGLAALTERGLVADGTLTDQGRELRDEVETATDAAMEPVVAALGAGLDATVERLAGWSEQVVDRGWFPPDPYKRASG